MANEVRGKSDNEEDIVSSALVVPRHDHEVGTFAGASDGEEE